MSEKAPKPAFDPQEWRCPEWCGPTYGLSARCEIPAGHKGRHRIEEIVESTRYELTWGPV